MFSFKSDLSEALETTRIVLPYSLPNDTNAFVALLKGPLQLTIPTKDKKLQNFELPDSLFSVEFDTSGDRPVAILSWSEQGWDLLSYRYLTHMAREVKRNPKSVARSYRTFANLMDKLTEEPTGDGKIDQPRKIVLDRNTQTIAPNVKDIVASRIQQWKM